MFKSSLIACAMLATAFQAHALDFTVTGKITPGICSVTLSGGGVVPYGTVTAATVTSTWIKGSSGGFNRYESPAKNVPFSVVCPSPTKFSLSFLDNRKSTVISATTDTSVAFGLGSYNNGVSRVNIGNYIIAGKDLLFKATPTSTAVVPAKRFVTPGVATPTSIFSAATGLEAAGYMPNDKSVAWGSTAAVTTPDAFTEISGSFGVTVEVLKTVVDSATTDIDFDGAGTITIIVL